MDKTNDTKSLSVARTFISLKYPNYRLWFIGQMVSLFGTWMQTTAMGFYVYELTLSKTFLGYVVFAAGLPTIFFMFFGGIAADVIPRRRLLLITQTVMLVLALILSGLTFLKLTNRYHLIVIAFLNGIANAFDAPARQSFVLEMVEKDVLTNAIALNSTMFNIATVVGPALGGPIYALFGPAWCFTINGISYLAVISALLLMRLKLIPRSAGKIAPLKGIFQGVRYVMQESRIRLFILITAMMSFFGFSVFTLFPAWAKEILGGDAATNGWLQSARGLGSLFSAFTIAALGSFRFKGKLLTIGMFVFPCALLIFAFITLLPLSLFVVMIAGMGMMLIFNLANSIIQGYVKDEFRGRVMSVYSLTFFGCMPLGALLAGVLSDLYGAQTVIAGSAVLLLIFSLAVFIFAREIRAA